MYMDTDTHRYVYTCIHTYTPISVLMIETGVCTHLYKHAGKQNVVKPEIYTT